MVKLSRVFLLEQYKSKGLSVFEIARASRCSEHKVNYWLHKFKVQKRSISEAIYLKKNPDGDPFTVSKLRTSKKAKLFGMGLGIYWGEGNRKSKTSIRVGNTNPALIRKFIEFLLEIFKVDVKRLRFSLQIFSDIPPQKALRFWLMELKPFGISKSQFTKVTVTPARSIGTYREKSRYGVLTVNFHNTKLKKIIDGMLPL